MNMFLDVAAHSILFPVPNKSAFINFSNLFVNWYSAKCTILIFDMVKLSIAYAHVKNLREVSAQKKRK